MKPFADLRKHIPDLAIPNEPVRPGVPWTVHHLRPGLVCTAIAVAIGAPIAGVIGGWRWALGVLLGLVIVSVFFVLSAVAVAAAGRRDDRLTLPAALLAFGLKVVLLGALMVLIPADGPIDVKVMAWAVLAGVLIWLAAHIRFVLRQRTPYVHYEPPKELHD